MQCLGPHPQRFWPNRSVVGEWGWSCIFKQAFLFEPMQVTRRHPLRSTALWGATNLKPAMTTLEFWILLGPEAVVGEGCYESWDPLCIVISICSWVELAAGTGWQQPATHSLSKHILFLQLAPIPCTSQLWQYYWVLWQPHISSPWGIGQSRFAVAWVLRSPFLIFYHCLGISSVSLDTECLLFLTGDVWSPDQLRDYVQAAGYGESTCCKTLVFEAFLLLQLSWLWWSPCLCPPWLGFYASANHSYLWMHRAGSL